MHTHLTAFICAARCKYLLNEDDIFLYITVYTYKSIYKPHMHTFMDDGRPALFAYSLHVLFWLFIQARGSQ